MSDVTSKALSKGDTRRQLELPTASEPTVLSVENLNAQIKQALEGNIGTVWVQGEISNFKAHTSGHFYFSLKDSKTQIMAVMFRGSNSRLKFKPTDGLEVLVRGRVTVYEPRGNYQLLCEAMEPVGAGALQKAFEQLKDKLKSEGLFEASRKRPIPAFPRHVAIVTSPTGAAIRDMLNVLSRRAKSVRITLIPTIVQGPGSGALILEALNKAALIPDVDVVIIGRGGGSIEDMWGFNDEALARAIAAHPKPVISAVGHEIDFTIADFVADLRAPTPSAAAELVARSSNELSNRIVSFHRLLKLSLDQKLRTYVQKLNALDRQLIDPRKRLQDLAMRNDELLERLERAALNIFKTRRQRVEVLRAKLGDPSQRLAQRRQRLESRTQTLHRSLQLLMERRQARVVRLGSLLDSFSPLKVVERGYSIVTKNKTVIKSHTQLAVGDELKIRLAEGEATASVTGLKGQTDGL